MSLDRADRPSPGVARPEDLLAHASWVRGVALRLVEDAATADDVVQETWLAALRQPPATDRPLRPWLAGVVRNLVRQRRRGEGRRAAREEAVAKRRTSERLPSPDELAERLETQQRLAEHVRRLPEPFRRTVLLRYYEGLDGAEIARRDGIPAGTVRWRLSRAMDLLRERLDEQHGARRVWCLALIPLAAQRPVSTGATAAAGTGLVAAVVQGVVAMGVGAKIGIVGVATVAALVLALGAGLAGFGGWGDQEAPSEPVDVAFVPLETAVPGITRRRVTVTAGDDDEETTSTPPPEADDAPAPIVLLAGRAVDEGGDPLARVLVRAETGEATETAPDGTFALRSEQAIGFSRLSLRLSAPGRATADTTVAVTAGEAVHVGDVTLGPGGAVSGRVVDAAGAAVPGAWVSLDGGRGGDMPYGARRRLVTSHGTPGRRVRAGDDGRFRVNGVPAGVVRLWAGEKNSLATLSGPVTVRAGMESRGVALVLEPLPGDQLITGRVVSPDGEGVAEARLRYEFDGSWRRSGSGTMGVETDGTFRIVLPYEATYRLTATDRLDRWGDVSVEDVAGGARDVMLRLPAVQQVRLFVTGLDGAPVTTFSASFQDPRRGVLFDYSEVRGAEDGAAILRLPAQEFFVSVEAPGFAEASIGPFAEDTPPGPIRIALTPLPGVTGRVTDGQSPVAGARVTAHAMVRESEREVHNGFQVRSHARAVAETITDTDGRFELTVREAGRYVVRVGAEGRAPAESRVLAIDPSVGLSGVDVVLGAGGSIEGIVSAANGRSPSGTVVGISRGDGFAVSQRVGPEGRYRFDRLTPGPWEVRRLDADIVPGSSTTTTSPGSFDVDWTCRVVEGGVTCHDLGPHSAPTVRVEGSLRVDGAPASGWSATLLLGGGAARRRGPSMVTLDDGRFVLETSDDTGVALILASPDDLLRFVVDAPTGPVDMDVSLGTLTVVGAASGADDPPPLAVLWVDGHDDRIALVPLPGATDEPVRVRVPSGACRVVEQSATEPDPRGWPVLRELDVPPGGTIHVDLAR